MDCDLTKDPLGTGSDGQPVYLKDIWPRAEEVNRAIGEVLTPESFLNQYANVFAGNERWNRISAGASETYAWDADSTYIQSPPFFEGLSREVGEITDISGALVLVMVGDSITTDHISPAGVIKPSAPAGMYLQERGVEIKDFNSYGSRRGNDRVMTRGTFANVRLRNLLAPGTEGGVTVHLPTGEQMSVYDAAMKYMASGTPLVVLGGKEYGTGSSRDWAAKGTLLLGVGAVLAESFERIHRSNLVGMGVLPLQFADGDSVQSLGLTGQETFDIQVRGPGGEVQPRQEVTVKATAPNGGVKTFQATARLDTPVEVEYYRNGGILQTVIRGLVGG
jgi:aconitate hydratase